MSRAENWSPPYRYRPFHLYLRHNEVPKRSLFIVIPVTLRSRDGTPIGPLLFCP
jgi:hypothetical protein